MKLSKMLNKLCKERNISLAQLSRASGVPAPTIHGWKTGRSALKLNDLKKVAAALEVSVHRLAFGEPDPFEITDVDLDEIFSGDVRVTIQRIRKKSKESK